MARIVPLFSGSKGNCYYIGTAAEGVLIDAGRNCKQIELAMEANGLSMKSVGAVFVTHEHIDHCSALKVLAKKHSLPIYASEGTLNALVALGGMRIQRIDTPHDAAESCCYRVTSPDGKIAMIATDIGHVTEQIRSALTDCQLVVLESNHDIDMLRTGPYTYVLKKRILSDIGHLSNDACATELSQLVRNGTLRLILGHLSEMNNTPQIALRTSVAELGRVGRDRRVHKTPRRVLQVHNCRACGGKNQGQHPKPIADFRGTARRGQEHSQKNQPVGLRRRSLHRGQADLERGAFKDARQSRALG